MPKIEPLSNTQAQVTSTLLRLGPGLHSFHSILEARFGEKINARGTDETSKLLEVLCEQNVIHTDGDGNFQCGIAPPPVSASRKMKDLFFEIMMESKWIQPNNLCAAFYEGIAGEVGVADYIREFNELCNQHDRPARPLGRESRLKSAMLRKRLGLMLDDGFQPRQDPEPVAATRDDTSPVVRGESDASETPE